MSDVRHQTKVKKQFRKTLRIDGLLVKFLAAGLDTSSVLANLCLNHSVHAAPNLLLHKPGFSDLARAAPDFLLEKPRLCVRDDNLLFAALEFQQQEASTDTDEN